MRCVLNILYAFHKLAPTGDRISIVSRQTNEPYEDLLMLADELRRQSPDTEVVFCCERIGDGLKAKCRYAVHMCTRQMHLFATSRVVVLDTYSICASNLAHKKSLKIVQIWHALGVFKTYGYTAAGKSDGRDEVVAEAMRMHRKNDVVFASSEACRDAVAASFGCRRDQTAVCPLPRTDLLKDPDWMKQKKQQVFDACPSLKGRRIILYVPTFRRDRDIENFAAELAGAFGGDSAVISKLHPNDCGKTNIVSLEKFSSLELLSAADYVVTDYSAFLFEAAFAGIPVCRFVPDEEEYEKNHGFLIDDIPFFKSRYADEIANYVKSGVCDSAAAEAFVRKYVNSYENNTEKMAEIILNLSEGKL